MLNYFSGFTARTTFGRISGGAILALMPVAFVLPTASAASDSTSGLAPWRNLPPAVQLACDQLGTGVKCTQLQVRKLPYLGKTIYAFKTRDASAKQGRLCIDDVGSAVADCGDEWQRQDRALRYADYGAIQPDLWTKLQGAAPNELIPVGIWLATSEPAVAKETVTSTELAANKAAIASQHAIVKQKLLEAAQKLAIADIKPLNHAPAAFARLTANQIVTLAKTDPIARLGWWPPPVPQWTTYVSTVGANSTGYTGSGTNVCIIEQYKYSTPNYVTFAGTYCGTGSTTEHGRRVAGVVNQSASPYGTAPDSTLYYAHWDNCDASAAPSFDWCIDQSTNIWNFSHSCSSTDRQLFDYWTKVSPYPLMVLASGNDGPYAQNCGTSCGDSPSIPETSCAAYNALVVGGSNDCGTTGRTDDEIYCEERSLDPDTDRETPHLVAPAQNIEADGLTGQNGTSFAAPNVAGIAAQMIEVNPSSMRPWPELMRAILIATADENVHGGRMTLLGSDIDHRDGAGEVNALFATDLADSANKMNGNNTPCEKGYDMATLNTSSPAEGNYYSEEYKIKTTASGKKARVVVVWDSTATCSYPAAGTCSADGMDADIDIEVSDGTTTYYSESVSNTYEFLEFSATQNVTWTVKIKVYDWFNSGTFMAVAWYVADFNT